MPPSENPRANNATRKADATDNSLGDSTGDLAEAARQREAGDLSAEAQVASRLAKHLDADWDSAWAVWSRISKERPNAQTPETWQACVAAAAKMAREQGLAEALEALAEADALWEGARLWIVHEHERRVKEGKETKEDAASSTLRSRVGRSAAEAVADLLSAARGPRAIEAGREICSRMLALPGGARGFGSVAIAPRAMMLGARFGQPGQEVLLDWGSPHLWLKIKSKLRSDEGDGLGLLRQMIARIRSGLHEKDGWGEALEKDLARETWRTASRRDIEAFEALSDAFPAAAREWVGAQRSHAFAGETQDLFQEMEEPYGQWMAPFWKSQGAPIGKDGQDARTLARWFAQNQDAAFNAFMAARASLAAHALGKEAGLSERGASQSHEAMNPGDEAARAPNPRRL